jgi:hypothetical protein
MRRKIWCDRWKRKYFGLGGESEQGIDTTPRLLAISSPTRILLGALPFACLPWTALAQSTCLWMVLPHQQGSLEQPFLCMRRRRLSQVSHPRPCARRSAYLLSNACSQQVHATANRPFFPSLPGSNLRVILGTDADKRCSRTHCFPSRCSRMTHAMDNFCASTLEALPDRASKAPGGGERSWSRAETATGIRNPSTWRVLPDKDAGIEWIFYPWVRYWLKSYTHRVCGYECGCILPIPVYPQVRHTRKNN